MGEREKKEERWQGRERESGNTYAHTERKKLKDSENRPMNK